MKKILFALALAALGCGCLTDCSTKCCAAKAGPRVKHVVLVGVDGFGAQWIPWDKMPNLTKLRTDGLYAVGRNSFPTSSGINWCTCMNGTVVEVHGYRVSLFAQELHTPQPVSPKRLDALWERAVKD